jgi:hypothetical protein
MLVQFSDRHGRACPGHPRLKIFEGLLKTWMPGIKPGMTQRTNDSFSGSLTAHMIESRIA